MIDIGKAYAELLMVLRADRRRLKARRNAISADTTDLARINNFELWESEGALEAWRAVSNPPAEIAPMQVGEMQKHEISKSGPPL